MVYGLTLQGKRDPRLVHFAQCFAQSGFRVAIPDLTGLTSLTLHEGDLVSIKTLVTKLYADHKEPVGICAFSFGAGFSLLAASDPELSDIIDPLLLFGPYYSLPELWNSFATDERPPPTNENEWDALIWLRSVRAFHALDALKLQDHEKQEIIDFLTNYCTEPSITTKINFYERILKRIRIPNMKSSVIDETTLQRLSPYGRLGTIQGRVLILHDRYDILIPPHHSEGIYDELCLRGSPYEQRLLITPLLSHVTARSVWKIFDVFRIVDMIGGIYH